MGSKWLKLSKLQGVNMYRIQAHNLRTGRIEVFIVNNRGETMQRLEENPDYGLITFEYNPRGAFYR